MMELPPILDMTCGGRMMWHDKKDGRILAFDCRRERLELCDGRIYDVDPDVVGDFRALPFPDESFYHVIFDPPPSAQRRREGVAEKEVRKAGARAMERRPAPSFCGGLARDEARRNDAIQMVY